MKYKDSNIPPRGLDRSLRFYVTNLSPCPYLDGQYERKAFTNLAITDADAIHNVLGQSGFRRSQSIAYRPICPRCNACRSVRVNSRDYEFSKSERRFLNKNQHLVRTPAKAQPTREQFRLLKNYLKTRHQKGGMAEMHYRDYANMIGTSPVQTLIFEYRDGEGDDAPLVAAALSDVMRDGFSMVYTFFDPQCDAQSLGHFMILDHIKHAQERGLPHVYLGYWVKNSAKMAYKQRYQPLEILEGDVWREFNETDVQALKARAPLREGN